MLVDQIAVKTAIVSDGFPSQKEIDQQMGLPMLDSLPGAAATLYLDFDGNFQSSFSSDGKTFTNITTPVWDMDGNRNSFNSDEQAVIKEVWARVAEDYAPFNINVSTDYYGTFNNGQALRVAIGGDNTDWLHQDASGISSIGSFHDDQPNVVFAFDMVAWAKAGVLDGEGRAMNGPGALATTISHEAGHSFGLFHHSTYDGNGKLVDEYDPGSWNWTPIMGSNKSNDRTTWANLPTDQGVNNWQDDMAVIGGSTNGFGFRADDHGDTIPTADALVSTGVVQSITNSLSGKGIINTATDTDFFKFTATGGQTRIEVDAATYGPNLLPVLQLWRSGSMVANPGTVTPTRSIIDINLTAGETYYVRVRGLGDYGDVGQYTVTVSPVMTYQMTAVQTTTMTKTAMPYSPTTTTSTSFTTLQMSAGSGRGETFDIASPQHETHVTYATPQISAAVAKLLNGPNLGGAASQRLTLNLRTNLNDALQTWPGLKNFESAYVPARLG